MALFNILKKNKNEAAQSGSQKPKKVSESASAQTKEAPRTAKKVEEKGERFAHSIIRPRITEKASTQSGGNSYTFEVVLTADKAQIKKAIKEVYGVTPVKISIINVKPKRRFVRGISGKTAPFKKAIVFLKEGDTIEFV